MRKLLVLALLAAAPQVGSAQAQTAFVYRDICDASAAVALDRDYFVVADDELNILRIYQRDLPKPIADVPLWEFLGTKKDKESDIEGAARIGSRIYWVSSHGRNSDAEFQKRRHRFFATEIKRVPGKPPTVSPVGKRHDDLMDDLTGHASLKKYKLGEASEKAPEDDGGLNIEGLAATSNGELLIGFRNPLPGSKALVLRLENPDQVIAGHKPRIGAAFELQLGGGGIRSIENIGNGFLIVAGPHNNNGPFALYRWSGNAQDEPKKVEAPALNGLNSEALFAIPGTDTVQILSDDGRHGGVKCEDRPLADRSFRSVIIKP